MKKINIFSLFLLMLAFFTGCKEEKIILTSELPQFETRDGLMLLEVIVPYGTGINDQIYIYGDFNGGEEAVGNPQWLLQRGNPQSGVPAKFGIYINPNDFVNGKTLADGYTFYNIQSGPERNINNEPMLHYTYPATGQRLNVFVDYWEADFSTPENPDEVEHDGYAVYVINNTGWPELALYAWGDAEAFGGWPGMQVTGRMEINGVMYQYFDTGADNEGLNLNLIFNNNNNGSQLPDVNVDLNKDYYFELTPDGAIEIDPNASTPHDGYAIFIYNNSPDFAELYAWVWEDGSGGEDFLGVGWPGVPFTGTQMINGVAYNYFDFGSQNDGKTVNFIVNNNNQGKQAEVDGLVLDKNYYFELTGTTLTEVDPETFKPEGGNPETPEEPEPTPSGEYKIYISDQTGWDNFYVYAWGASEIFGAWPGASTTEKETIGGVEYLVFNMAGGGEEENLIFNNNNGTQYDAMVITVDQDYYIIAYPDRAEVASAPEYKLYIEDQTGWNNFYVYAWGEAGEIFSGWPGAQGTATEVVDGVTYYVFSFSGYGETENLIFNNNEGTQYDAMPITLDQDYYILAEPEGAKFK